MSEHEPKKRRTLGVVGLAVSLGLATFLLGFTWRDAPGSGFVQETFRSAWQGAVNAARGPVRVGIQVGHENVAAHPEEFARLRYNTGGHANGLDEVDLTSQDIAINIKEGLEKDRWFLFAHLAE